MEGAPKALTVCALASERIIVRASNPGQFEQDGGLGGLGGGAGPDGGLRTRLDAWNCLRLAWNCLELLETRLELVWNFLNLAWNSLGTA